MKLDQQHSNLKQLILVNILTSLKRTIKKASPIWTSLFLYQLLLNKE